MSEWPPCLCHQSERRKDEGQKRHRQRVARGERSDTESVRERERTDSSHLIDDGRCVYSLSLFI